MKDFQLQIFSSLRERMKLFPPSPLKIKGVTSEQWAFLFNILYPPLDPFVKRDHLFICEDESDARKIFSIFQSREASLYKVRDRSPYTSHHLSDHSLYEHFTLLDRLASPREPVLLVTSLQGLSQKVPPRSFFQEKQFKIAISDILPPNDLAKKLSDIGFFPTLRVQKPATFSMKGEIFDLYPIDSHPLRILYYDDMIETISEFDPQTLRTIAGKTLNKITISPCPQILSNPPYSTTLRENISPIPSQSYEKYKQKQELFKALPNDPLLSEYSDCTPLFFKKTETLADYLNDDTLLTFFEEEKLVSVFQEQMGDLNIKFKQIAEDHSNSCIMPEPSFFYDGDIVEQLKNFKKISITASKKTSSFQIDLNLKSAISYLKGSIDPNTEMTILSLKDPFEKKGNILLATKNNLLKKEILYFLKKLNFSDTLLERIHFIKENISSGFYDIASHTILLSEKELLGTKQKPTIPLKIINKDLFAEQFSSLKEGDLIIHRESGVGEYIGMKSLYIAGVQTDFFIIEYTRSDKIYVPVYKMDLIQKYVGTSKRDSLRSSRFKTLKKRAAISTKKLAIDLIKLQAERKISTAFAFSKPNHLFTEFELSFPYDETPDQSKAIAEVLTSMQKPLPMDHLVCGDVGFGKTEVAMRASFKAVLDKKQVAVLVPTTILALQHLNTFTKRFNNFSVKIESLSRFQTPKEVALIKERLKAGLIDILIGTHKLLAKDIFYQDLGLVIIDEEQRFGVVHKEKLKLMKTSVDFLTLTATPIPRTLQLAFLNIRDLSLIQTPPPLRQSIQSSIVKNNEQTIVMAVRKEIERGGQVFIVHNKIVDIEIFGHHIQQLIPEAKIIIAHGRTKESELERKIKDFYLGKYDVLISTTIIESGLDIPNANTILIDRAHTYGLSQLHQLRGRIGRSERKAYCYFMIPSTGELNPLAKKRLEALEKYNQLGSGFHIASSDLEIRGAGNILGGVQSGHIDNIGLELYTELLKDAIGQIRGEKRILRTNLEFIIPFSALIPTHYIPDSSERLKYYKLLSNSKSLDNIFAIKESLLDIYGPLPDFMVNLFSLMESKIFLQDLGIKTVQISKKNITLQLASSFEKQDLLLGDKAKDYFFKNPKIYHISPSGKVSYTANTTVTSQDLVLFSKKLKENILPST